MSKIKMSKKEIKKTLKKAQESLRKKDAGNLATEEISELITELSLLSSTGGSSKHVSEEVSDVYITLDLLVGVYGLNKKEIAKYKKEHAKAFKEYTKMQSRRLENDMGNIQSAIFELSRLSKVICKLARGRRCRGRLVKSIAAVELTLDYLQNHSSIIHRKDVDEWREEKLARMKRRLHDGGIV